MFVCSTVPVASLEQALSEYVKPEELSGDNQYECEQCKAKAALSRSLRAARLHARGRPPAHAPKWHWAGRRSTGPARVGLDLNGWDWAGAVGLGRRGGTGPERAIRRRGDALLPTGSRAALPRGTLGHMARTQHGAADAQRAGGRAVGCADKRGQGAALPHVPVHLMRAGMHPVANRYSPN